MSFSVKNSSGIFVRNPNLLTKDSPLNPKLLNYFNVENPRESKIDSVHQLFEIGCSIAGEDAPYIGTRSDENSSFTWISYLEFNQMASNCAAGIEELGVEEGSETNIAIYSRMSPQVQAFIFAAIKRRNVIVPIYNTLGKDSIEFVIREVSPKIIFCDNQNYADTILSFSCLEGVYLIVAFSISEQLEEKAKQKKMLLLNFENLAGKNGAKFLKLVGNFNEDLLYIMYTSGSTGTPKGVEVTQRQIISVVVSLIIMASCEREKIDLTNVVHYSYLPFQHCFETVSLFYTTALGGKIGILAGDITMMASDMQELQPSFLPTVPRVLEKFREKILLAVDSSNFIIRFIFRWNLNRRIKSIKGGAKIKPNFIDQLIFGKIRQNFGGKLEAIIVGAAPLAPKLEYFTRAVFGVVLCQGFGATETGASGLLQSIDECGAENVGAPIPGAEIKLVDVSELEYFAANGVGEIFIRGPMVTRGYYKRPEQTEESFDSDGFFKTGDIGCVGPSGTFRIIDRVKNIFKLSQGEYILPDKIEEVYKRHPVVSQMMVYGEGTENYVLAVVIVREKEFGEFSGLSCLEEAIESGNVRDKLLKELRGMGKKAQLCGFEQVRGIVIDSVEFTVENGLLTPTMKMRRPQITRKYYEKLHSLYM